MGGMNGQTRERKEMSSGLELGWPVPSYVHRTQHSFRLSRFVSEMRLVKPFPAPSFISDVQESSCLRVLVGRMKDSTQIRENSLK